MKPFNYSLSAMAICAVILTGCEKPDQETPDPEVPTTGTPELVTENTVFNIEADGGRLSIPYTIENPAETGTVSAKNTVVWIAVDAVSTSDIQLTVEANNLTETRSSTINIVYTFGEDSDTVSTVVTIEQDARIPDPELVLSTDMFTVSAEGGEITIPFIISNPVEGGTVSTAADADWLTEKSVSKNEVSFTIAQNMSAQDRTAKVTLTYTYGEGNTATAEADIVQEGAEGMYDHYLPETYSYAQYWDYGEIFRYFSIQFSDKEIVDGTIAEGACNYNLTIYVNDIDDSSNPVPPDGTYTYSESLSAGTFSGWYYPTTNSTGCGISEGEMTVSKDGDYLLITFELTDTEGATHYVRYYGIPSYDIAFQL